MKTTSSDRPQRRLLLVAIGIATAAIALPGVRPAMAGTWLGGAWEARPWWNEQAPGDRLGVAKDRKPAGWRIDLPSSRPQHGETVCVVIAGPPGAGPPTVTISVDNGPPPPLEPSPLGSGRYQVCFVMPDGWVRLTAGSGGVPSTVRFF